jgi:hypothetical protein
VATAREFGLTSSRESFKVPAKNSTLRVYQQVGEAMVPVGEPYALSSTEF